MDLLLTRDLFAVDNLLVLFICLNYHSLYAYRLQGVPRATMLSPRSSHSCIRCLLLSCFVVR